MPVATVRISVTDSSGCSETAAVAAPASSMVFHSEQVGHWPVQRADAAPQAVQA